MSAVTAATSPAISALVVEIPTTLTELASTKGRDEGEEDAPTASSSLSSSLLSSSTPSISSSTTTDTSFASDTNSGCATLDKVYTREEENGTTMSTATITDIKHTAPSPPSPTWSSSASLPVLPPTSSSSASDIGPSVSSSAIPSLLQQRPPPQPILNVKFAPLPEKGSRKRRSNVPLGMAARGQMARRRRAYMDGYDDDDYYDYRPHNGHPQQVYHPNPAEEEKKREEKARKKAKKAAAALARLEEKEDGAEKEGELKRDAENDPLVALAKKMGKAGKHIWRKVSNKDGKPPNAAVGDVNLNGKEDKVEQTVTPTATVTPNPEDEQKEIQELEQGGVWVEEVEEAYRHSEESGTKSPIDHKDPTLHPDSPTPDLPHITIGLEKTSLDMVVPSPTEGKFIPQPPTTPVAVPVS